MNIAKDFFFAVIAPLIILIGYSFALARGAPELAKAWKAKSFKGIWFNIWLILAIFYFIIDWIKT